MRRNYRLLLAIRPSTPTMEEGHLRKIISPGLETVSTKTILEKLQNQVDEAETLRDLKAAKSPLVRSAIKVVEKFLKKTGRICYGGQAINALLPSQLKFYDPKKTIPDYDVYTPTLEKDLRAVLSQLRREGFPEVGHREGLHEGTIKISVAYNDILDLTAMDPEIYGVLVSRAATVGGIHYADANFLRSNMYKELSQPEGEIDRWEKVYTRLVLLNEAIPVKTCKEGSLLRSGSAEIPKNIYLEIIDFLIANKRILAGANIDQIYKKKTKNYSWILEDTQVPIIFYSPDIENDTLHLKTLIDDPKFRSEIFEAHGDVVPAAVCIFIGDILVAIIVEEGACYSYNKISIGSGSSSGANSELLVGSLDTAIRLFYQLSLLRDFPAIAETSIHCVAQNLVDISMKIRSGAIQSQFPLFSIECSGHQFTKGSLIREKRLRGKLRKLTKKTGAVMRNRSKTLKMRQRSQKVVVTL